MEVQRFDRGELTDISAEMTEDGFLRARANITRTGVFPYQLADGTIRRELRHPDDVFDAESLKSFAMLPVTLGHPDETVRPDNARKYQVGALGESVRRDGAHVTSPIAVHDAAAIAAIRSGEAAEISNGYRVTLVDEKGVFEGEAYDARQTNIRGNHCALVRRGRAGPTVRMPRLDAGDAIQVEGKTQPATPAPTQETSPLRKDRAMETIVIDGVPFECPAQTVKAVTAHLEKVKAEAKAREDTLTAQVEQAKVEAKAKTDEADAAKAKADVLEEKLAAEKLRADEATKPETMHKAVEARLSLERSATKILGDKEKLDGKTDEEIRRLVVAKASPKLVLDGQPEAYINAAFAIVIEQANADAGDDDTPNPELGETRRAADKPAARGDADEAHRKMTTDYEAMGRKPLSA